MNYKHLRYFFTVAKCGSIATASERLHVAPQTISGQLQLLEETIGKRLFVRAGRRLELTDAGKVALGYAEEIFNLGAELGQALRADEVPRALPFRVGVSDAVPKSVTYGLLAPARQLPVPLQLVCREWKLESQLAELAVHRLDLVITDGPMPPSLSVRAFNHLLGECGVTFFAAPELASKCTLPFPRSLQELPLLLPGEDSALRAAVERWLENKRLRPRVVGEFDDSALMGAFGQAGAGVFPMPSVVAVETVRQLGVVALGQADEVRARFYAISIERRASHPAVVAIHQAARENLFGRSIATRVRARRGNRSSGRTR